MKQFETSDLLKDFNKILSLCKNEESGLLLTNKESTDLVVFDVESFHKREQSITARMLVYESFLERLQNKNDYIQ